MPSAMLLQTQIQLNMQLDSRLLAAAVFLWCLQQFVFIDCSALVKRLSQQRAGESCESSQRSTTKNQNRLLTSTKTSVNVPPLSIEKRKSRPGIPGNANSSDHSLRTARDSSLEGGLTGRSNNDEGFHLNHNKKQA